MSNQILTSLLASNTLSKEQREALEAMLKASQPKLGLKVSEKTGALSFYGLGRFPLTLYKSQWLKLLEKTQEIHQFIIDNNDKLTEKE